MNTLARQILPPPADAPPVASTERPIPDLVRTAQLLSPVSARVSSAVAAVALPDAAQRALLGALEGSAWSLRSWATDEGFLRERDSLHAPVDMVAVADGETSVSLHERLRALRTPLGGVALPVVVFARGRDAVAVLDADERLFCEVVDVDTPRDELAYRVERLLALHQHHTSVVDANRIVEENAELLRQIATQERQARKTKSAAIFALSKLAESRDPETGEHLARMREYCLALARVLAAHPKFSAQLTPTWIESLCEASPLHDVGKVGIPDRILLKPGPLTAEEFEIMKAHTTIGADTLHEVARDFPGNEFIDLGVEIARHHHERWDGTGYPHRLAGEQIPLSARILAVGDVYDALTSRRVYKDAFSHAESRKLIVNGRGSQFDPDVVDAFLACETEFIVIRAQFVDMPKTLIS